MAIKDRTVYFAHIEEGEEYLSHLHDFIARFYDFIENAGLNQIIYRSYLAYYGGDLNKETDVFNSAIISKTGKANQISQVKANNYRNLVKHAVSLATANKPALTTVAANTDYKSQAQTILANSLLDYYFNVENIGEQVRKATEYSCITGEGWLHLPWEPNAGEMYDVGPDGRPVYTGELDVSYHDLTDVIRDTTLKSTTFPWLMLRKLESKFDLAARYPSKAEKIVELTNKNGYFEDKDDFRRELVKGIEQDSDLVNVYYFYHDKTSSMPRGRITIFAGDLILFDGNLPYAAIPLVPVMPDVLHKSCFGYSPFNDLIGLQQAQDNLMSTVLSNNLSFGMQNLWMPDGMDINVANLEGGLRLIQTTVQPQPLQLTQSSPEAYNLINMLSGMQETLSGISSTVRGNPESNLKSGAALALVVAQSVQFGSALENSYNSLLTKVGEIIIKHLQSFAKQPRMATIVGTAKRPLLKEFTREDLKDIRRVQVQQANAMSKTISGRLELAQQVMQLPPDQARQFMSIVNTGQLPDEMQVTAPILTIKAENERFQAGQPVSALIIENHAEHIQAHTELLSSPEAKENPDLVELVLAHIQEHLDLWRKADPAILMITKQQPPPPAPAPIPPPVQPAQPMGGQPAPQPVDVPNMEPIPVEGSEEAQQPNMPGMPQGTDPNSQAAYEQYLANMPPM